MDSNSSSTAAGGAPITFVLIDAEPLAGLAALQPERDWREFVQGERAWILQTYLRLRAAGHCVALADRLPAQGIAVFSSKQRNALVRTAPRAGRALLLGVREDVGAALIADFEVVQNAAQADGRRRFLVPLWAQPALIARDPGRGTRIENLGFKGYLGNLDAAFRGAQWQQACERIGLRWRADALPYTRGLDRSALNWNDFSEVDLVLAVRPSAQAPHIRKPASKLYNAWRAGVPALLGPESAYRELRRSPLDYLEIETPEQALAAIAALRAEPQRYLAMIEQGRRRAADFTSERIVQQWVQLLFVTLPAASTAAHVSRWRGRSLVAKRWVRRLPFCADL
jgi:hypothetical protein